jgi:predicted acyl esterase
VDMNVTHFEIETKTRHGGMVRADVYLPRHSAGPFPVLLGASPYQKSFRYLPPVPATFPFIEYGPNTQALDESWRSFARGTYQGCGQRSDLSVVWFCERVNVELSLFPSKAA